MMDSGPQQNKMRGGNSSHWQHIAAGAALSALFHGLVIAGLVLSIWWTPEEEESEYYDVVFEELDLLALGELPDPNALPRIAGGAPPVAVEDEVVLEPEREPEAIVEPETPREPEPDPEAIRRQREEEEARREEEQRRRREERRRQMERELSEFEAEGRGSGAPVGSPDGVPEGTVSDAALANMQQTYQARLRREIQQHWQVPVTIPDEELRRLVGRVRVYVRLSADGYIEEYEFTARSDNDQFNDSVERVLRRFERRTGRSLPMPSQPELQREVLRQGLNLNVWDPFDQ